MPYHRLLPALAALLLAACDGSSSPREATVRWSADAGSPDNPWPSDRLRAGGIAAAPPGYFSGRFPDTEEFAEARAFLDTAQATIATVGGYSVYAPVVVPLSGRVDARGLRGVHLYDAEGTEVAVRLSYDAHLDSLLVTPDRPLVQNRRHLLAIADARLHPSADFTAAVGGELAPLAAEAVGFGAARDADELDLVLAFTTQSVVDDLWAIQARIDGTLGSALLPSYAPAPEIPGFTVGIYPEDNPTFDTIFQAENANPADIALVAQGTWQAYDFRGADRTFDTALVHGTGTPAMTTVDFRLAIPEGTAPEQGWPVAIVGHGFAGHGVEALQRAYSFASSGIATVGLTAPEHGFRGDLLDFFDFTRLLKVRDGFRQSAAEILEMERMLRNAHDAGIEPFDLLDVGRISYFGNSFGGLLGSPVSAASSRLDAVGLTVAGGRLTSLFDGETGELFLLLFASKVGLSVDHPRWPAYVAAFRPMAQWGIDPADPGACARYAPESRKVLIQEAVGDAIVLNVSTDDMRTAYDLPVLESAADPFTARGGMWVWDKDDHPDLAGNVKAHDLYWSLEPMRRQMEAFLESDGTILLGEE